MAQLLFGFVLAVAGCGRVAFDPITSSDASGATDDATSDGPTTMTCAESAANLACAGTRQFTICNDKCFVTCSDVDTADNALSRCRQASERQAASIRDQADQDCLVSIAPAEVWIGLRQNSSATVPAFNWSWVDGTPTSFLNWDSLQPDDDDSVENRQEQCAFMSTTGLVSDHRCVLLQAIACSH